MSRKQREIAERHKLFLRISRNVIETEGYASLSMDRIAEQAEYSKGTVYQHFSCKEEVLIQLCNNDAATLKELMDRAALYQGSTRERVLAFFVAYDIWSRLNPVYQDLVRTLYSSSTLEKVSEDSRLCNQQLHLSIIDTVARVVREAADVGDITVSLGISPNEIVFGLWSLVYGGQQLLSTALPFSELGIDDPEHALLRTCEVALDGHGWQPLSKDYDSQTLIESIQQAIFADEIGELAGRKAAI